MREDGKEEQEHHRVTHALLQDQSNETLDALVQGNYSEYGQYPHLEAVGRGIEVHVLVGGHSGLVGALENGVPARAAAEVSVHVACVVLPKVPQDDNVCRWYQCRCQGTTGGG